MPDTDAGEAIIDYLALCHARMEAKASTEAMSEGIRRFGAALATATPRATVADDSLPVLAALATLGDGELARRFRPIAMSLPWQPSRRTDDDGTESVVCALGRQLGLEGVEVGFTLLDAHRFYPEHHHAPEELYLTISGTADWRYGGAVDTETLGPDVLLYNHPDDVHSMLAGAEPMLAIWVLWDKSGVITI